MLCTIKLLIGVVYAKLLQVYVLSISTASAVDQYLGWGQELTLEWTQQKLLHLRQFLLQLVNIRFEWKCGKDKHASLSRICINYDSKKFDNTSMIIKIWGPVVQNLSRR